jgi:sugar lactone lactonase YvrE
LNTILIEAIMCRSFYLYAFALLLLSFLAISPIACTNPNPTGPLATYNLSPTSTFTPTSNPVSVTTLAGSGGVTFSNGIGLVASFFGPSGVAIDSSGNIYVGDQGNDLIRKITSGVVVSTYAGSEGVTGSTNGNVSIALFNTPTGVAVDSSGNVFVADEGNNLIRKITAGGVVSTLAGQAGVTGSTNGIGTSASFYNPYAIAVDSSGNVYVADEYNSLVRKITPGGFVSNVPGSFFDPTGIAVDNLGNVYVATSYAGNGSILKISSSGIVSTLAGGVTGTATSLKSPIGVAVDSSGNVYVGDSGNSLVRKVTQTGVVTTYAGRGSASVQIDGPAYDSTFVAIRGLAVDIPGNVYVADLNAIREIIP